MTKIYELFKELDEELQNRDISSEPFTYTTNGNDELIKYYGETVFSSHDSEFDKLQRLERIKFVLEDMIFCCQTAIYTVEGVKKKI